MAIGLRDTVSATHHNLGEVYGVVDAYQIHAYDEPKYLVRFYDDKYKERRLWFTESSVKKVK